jgi:hypothetical protein
MGLLAPLYLAGLAALSLPILFHLIRRTPRGRQTFGSLMFLAPSPPRLSRRSRLDQWLLLLLRAAALALLAMAFARPFLRETAVLPFDGLASRRVAILLDASASMRRGDLWRQAVAKVEETLADLGPRDDAALLVFDDRVRTIVEFAKESEPAVDKADLVRRRLQSLAPSWRSTDLGAALVAAANELGAGAEESAAAAEAQLVLVSDLQRGGRTDALQGFEWPAHVPVAVHRLSPERPTNATAQLLLDERQPEGEAPRVRVTNAANSTGEEFVVRWANGDKRPSGEAAASAAHPIYVPVGQSRVVRLERPAAAQAADRIVLGGDDAEFDNVHYVVPPRAEAVQLAYVGDEAADDPQALRYYLELALADDPLRKVEVQSHAADQPLALAAGARPKLVVVAQSIAAPLGDSLAGYLDGGGTLLAVLRDRPMAESLQALFDDLEFGDETAAGDESRTESYQMLGEVDFAHPLFAAFAEPRYSDFTKIHFWRHRPVSLREPSRTRVVARFDNGNPAILERSVGAGRAILLTSGWRPHDSQLALSSKFVPLIHGILDRACGRRMEAAHLAVGQSAALPASSAAIAVEMPDGARAALPAGAEAFDGADQPGLYRVRFGDEEFRFAVNVAGAESDTAPLELERLEQLGVRLNQRRSRAERAALVRQQRDIELEGRQKVWRWAIVAALATLMLETWLSGRASRHIRHTTEALA